MIHYIEDHQIIGEITKSDKLIIIDFFAEWCVPCQMMSKVLHDAEKAYSNEIEIFKVNVDENQDTAIRYGINSMPTLVFFRNGEEIERKIGFLDISELTAIIEDLK